MLSPDQIQKLSLDLPKPVEKKWDKDRVKELTLCLGAAGIAGLGLIDGFLPRNPEPAPASVVSEPVWPIEADNDMLIEQIPRNPVKDPHEESAHLTSYDPTKTPGSMKAPDDMMHAEDLTFPKGTTEYAVDPASMTVAPIEDARRQEDYTLAR